MKEISALGGKSSTNTTTSKSGSEEMMETTNTSETTDGDAAGKKGIPTPPKTSGEVFEKQRLVLYDVNAVSFLIGRSKVGPRLRASRVVFPSMPVSFAI